MNISAEQVKKLREKTGVGIMDCKEALKSSNGDIDNAVDYLRKKGVSTAQKKCGRATSEGVITPYIHTGGKMGVLVEVNCETDFVARTDKFQTLAKDIAMHIAAASPLYVNKEDVPADVLNKEKEIYTSQMQQSGKPAHIIDKIVEGKIEKYYKDACLVEQPFIKNPDITIRDLVTQYISELGENLKISRFAKFQVGDKE